MNAGDASLSGLLSESRWTATTLPIDSTSATLFAGTIASTPPYTVRNDDPTCADGTFVASADLNCASCDAAKVLCAFSAGDLPLSGLPVTDGLVAGTPLMPPAYVAAES